MEQKPNSICEICDKPYYRCSKCDSTPHYKTHTCSPECYQIYMVLSEVEADNNVLTNSEAAQKFAYLGITLDSDFNKYRDGVASSMKRIIKEGMPKAEPPKKKNKSKLFD